MEISRLKQQVENEISEKEAYKNKVRFLEQQVLDIKSDESNYLGDYKEISLLPSLDNQTKVTLKLREENEELNNLNNVLKTELDKLSKQIELLEKKKVHFFLHRLICFNLC